MAKSKEKKGFDISAKSFITAIVIIFVLMCLTYFLTFAIPGGEYARIADANGNMIVDTETGFKYTEGGISFVKWLFSPFLVLTAEGSGTIIAVITFLLVVGGIFNALDKCSLMKYMLDKIVARFGHARYKLMSVTVLFFMALGSFVGSFEECVPLVPIVVALSVSLGWDALTGLGMSLLSIGCGFAAGVCNPFTVGVAQKLADLPMFSGIWLRLVSFAVVYALLLLFIRRHAKKVERHIENQVNISSFKADKKMDKGLYLFAGILLVGILTVLSSAFITALQSYTMVIVAVMFLAAGLSAILATGTSIKTLGIHFFHGLVSILPAVLMILMASSIKYTLEEANILDTLLHYAVGVAEDLPKWAVILFIYLLVLIMNFFISSGSAKAFLFIPLIVPIAQIFGISSQLAIVAFAFGDGFSNVLYPTNPVLLISLGLANVSYVKWLKHTWKFQLLNAAVTSALLLFGLVIGYN